MTTLKNFVNKIENKNLNKDKNHRFMNIIYDEIIDKTNNVKLLIIVVIWLLNSKKNVFKERCWLIYFDSRWSWWKYIKIKRWNISTQPDVSHPSLRFIQTSLPDPTNTCILLNLPYLTQFPYPMSWFFMVISASPEKPFMHLSRPVLLITNSQVPLTPTSISSRIYRGNIFLLHSLACESPWSSPPEILPNLSDLGYCPRLFWKVCPMPQQISRIFSGLTLYTLKIMSLPCHIQSFFLARCTLKLQAWISRQILYISLVPLVYLTSFLPRLFQAPHPTHPLSLFWPTCCL